MARILVTGGLGFIGSHLCERLCKDGHSIAVIDNYTSLSSQQHATSLASETRTAICRHDIRDPVDFRRLFPGYTFDMVIHLAAKAGVRASLNDPQGYVRTNVEGTINVLEACRQAGVSKVIFASSSSVYGHPETHDAPSSERDTPRPLSPYGVTKLAGEELCRTHAHLYGMRILCLRLFSVYGPRMRPDLAMPTFAAQMCAGEPVTLYGDGQSTRDYTYIEDVVEGFLGGMAYFARMPTAPGWCHVLNMGSGAPVCLRTMVEALAFALGAPCVPLCALPPHPADASDTHADITNAWWVLHYRPYFHLYEGVQHFADWYRASAGALHPEGT